MRGLLKFFVRTSAFISKEIREIVRQPRLVLSLILGPFLILALFGIGYRSQPPVLNTVIVVPEDPVLSKTVQQYAPTFGEQLKVATVQSNTQLAGLLTSQDPATAGQRQSAVDGLLAQYNADLVAAFPPDAARTIESGMAAPFVMYHNTVDPVRAQYVSWFGSVYTDAINRVVLMSVAQQAQGSTGNLQQEVGSIHQATENTRAALVGGDRVRASQSAQQMDQASGQLVATLGATVGLLASVQSNVGGGGSVKDAQNALAAAQRLRQQSGAISQALAASNGGATQDQIGQLAQIEQDTSDLDKTLATFNSIPPEVLAAPFVNKTENVAAISPDFVKFYGPGVLALLLQHLAVTMAALSLVRERQLGALEVFRVSPLSSFETLVGKYVSFMLFSLVIAAALVALLVFGLGIPVQAGTWPPTPQHLVALAVTIAALIAASLGIGFIISALSQTDSQAVQLSMIVLLASIFFSGFFLSLDSLYGISRVVAFLLPVTYGIRALQALMLRGETPMLPDMPRLLSGDVALWSVSFAALVIGSLVFFVLADRFLARTFKRV
ncbi:MAG: ABC transporter permease [Anaerolineae bacterium]